MKLKYYLRGIGIGVVVTTIIFMILISIHKNDLGAGSTSGKNTESKTVAEVNKETQETESEDAVSPKQPSDFTDDTNAIEKTNTETDVDEDTEADEETETDEKADIDEEADTEHKEEKVRFEIRGGEYSDVICRKLVEAGLIDNAASFNKFLVEKDYDNSILPGVYDIPRDSTYEEIAMLLTTKVD